MGYTTFTTYQLVSRIFWTINFVSLKFESPNRCCTWLTWLNQLVKPGFSAPSTVVPLISSVQPSRGSVRRVCLGNFQPNVVVFPQKKMDGFNLPKIWGNWNFGRKKSPTSVCLGENVSNMCFFQNVSPKICKIFRCCNKNAARICLGSGQEGSEFYYSKILEELHLFPEISDVFFHKSRYRPTGQGWACTKQRVNKNLVKVAEFTQYSIFTYIDPIKINPFI